MYIPSGSIGYGVVQSGMINTNGVLSGVIQNANIVNNGNQILSGMGSYGILGVGTGLGIGISVAGGSSPTPALMTFSCGNCGGSNTSTMNTLTSGPTIFYCTACHAIEHHGRTVGFTQLPTVSSGPSFIGTFGAPSSAPAGPIGTTGSIGNTGPIGIPKALSNKSEPSPQYNPFYNKDRGW